MKNFQLVVCAVLVAAVSGCATMPLGPSVNVLPASGKPFSQFMTEDANCRKWAEQSVGASAQDVQNQNVVGGATIGTLGGAAVGALMGSASGHAGAGAAIGAGAGLLMGSATGADSGRLYGAQAQRRYDNAYLQCMYASGNQLPSTVQERPQRVIVVPSPHPVYYAPPPPVYAAPPPPVYAAPPAAAPHYPPTGMPPPPGQ